MFYLYPGKLDNTDFFFFSGWSEPTLPLTRNKELISDGLGLKPIINNHTHRDKNLHGAEEQF